MLETHYPTTFVNLLVDIEKQKQLWSTAIVSMDLNVADISDREVRPDDHSCCDVMIAPKISDESWLRRSEFDWFIVAYYYAATQSRAIPALSKITPEELYFVITAMLRELDLVPPTFVKQDGK